MTKILGSDKEIKAWLDLSRAQSIFSGKAQQSIASCGRGSMQLWLHTFWWSRKQNVQNEGPGHPKWSSTISRLHHLRFPRSQWGWERGWRSSIQIRVCVRPWFSDSICLREIPATSRHLQRRKSWSSSSSQAHGLHWTSAMLHVSRKETGCSFPLSEIHFFN